MNSKSKKREIKKLIIDERLYEYCGGIGIGDLDLVDKINELIEAVNKINGHD